MKKFAITALLLCSASLAAVAAGIDGTWTSEMQVGDADGKTYSHVTTLTLKNDGGTLTGTMVQVSEAPWMKSMTGRSVDILDGKVDGEKYSFKVKMENKDGERTSAYEGTVEGDRLKGVIKYRGIGITRPFEAKRAN
jgi:hypothetical protein